MYTYKRHQLKLYPVVGCGSVVFPVVFVLHVSLLPVLAAVDSFSLPR